MGRGDLAHVHGTVRYDHAGTDPAQDTREQQHADVDRSGLERSRDDDDGSCCSVGNLAAVVVRYWGLDYSPDECAGQEAGLTRSVFSLWGAEWLLGVSHPASKPSVRAVASGVLRKAAMKLVCARVPDMALAAKKIVISTWASPR